MSGRQQAAEPVFSYEKRRHHVMNLLLSLFDIIYVALSAIGVSL